jgi:hypothetical protein
MSFSLLSGVMLLSLAAAKPAAPVEPGVAKAPPVATIQGAGALDDARKTAEAYLHALSGKTSDEAKSLLLGGMTLTAQDFKVPNWKIIERDGARIEDKDIAGAIKAMRELEKRGAEALTGVVVKEDSSVALSQADANKLLEPTRKQAQKFIEAYPLFAYISRVGKDVFWHPENPWIKETKNFPKSGQYHLEVHRFMIEEKDGSELRKWPLRVLRVTAKDYDSGWKILPASDWDPNY